MVTLSRLEEIRDLRTVWPHEALDFTPWLAQDENMALLSDAIEIDMTVDEIESCVGDSTSISSRRRPARTEQSSSRTSWKTPITTTSES